MLRYSVLGIVILLALISAALIAWSPAFWLVTLPFAFLIGLGVWDLVQPRHAILRNYPVIGHMRWLF